MLEHILRAKVLATVVTNPPLFFDRLYGLDWYGGILNDWIGDLNFPSGAKILELGCGPGNLSADLANMNYSVVGVDKSGRMIRWASKRQTAAEYVQTDAFDLPMSDDKFDVVLLASLLNLVPDRVKLLTEANRVLKPGGMISALFPTPEFNGTIARKLSSQHKLSPYSAAAISIWATFGKKLDPVETSDELLVAGLEFPKISFLLDGNIASVTGYKG